MRIPGYEVEQRLGEGGQAVVFCARRLEDGVRVAVKVGKAGVLTRDDCATFRGEAEILLSLRHEGVIRAFRLFEVGSVPAYEMEYFPSLNLKDALRQQPDLVQAHRYGVALQLAKTLYYLHEEGVVHRDLKPDNVLVNEQGETKLIDFSLAMTRWKQRFRPRKIQGTPQYMAPEQIRKEKIDRRTDVYSLGVLLFEVLAGRLPFPDKATDEQWLNAHLRERPLSAQAVAPGLPAALDRLLAQMLRKLPQERPDSMQPVVQALKLAAAR